MSKRIPFVFLSVLYSSLLVAGADPFVGEIVWMPYSFAPSGYHACDGTLLPISQNNALFSLLGTTYGGNGSTNFALPDARGRAFVHAGQGNGLTNRLLGEAGGNDQNDGLGIVTYLDDIISAQTPNPPDTNVNREKQYVSVIPITQTSMQPFLGMNCYIAMQGIFPAQP